VDRYGDLVAFPMPRTPVLLVNTPAGARHILVDNWRGYGKRTVQYSALAEITGQGLLTADGQLWREHRRVLQPAFRRDGVTVTRRVPEQAVAAAGRLGASWDAAPGVPLDAEAAVLQAMLELVGFTLFDDDLAPVAGQVVHAVELALRRVLREARSPLPARLPTPGRIRMRRAVATLDHVVRDVVRRGRLRPAGGDPDPLALLLNSGLDDRAVRDELVTLIIAGHETVACVLTWTLGLLASDPAVQDRLLDELDTVLAGGRRPAQQDLADLPYARAVIDESLRLYPPAWVLTRRAIEDDVVAGVPVPAGTLLLVSPWLLHRRPACWPDPDRFDPDRFRPPAGQPEAGAYLPFGAGPRTCIGREIALVETVLVLATLLRSHRVVRPNHDPLPRPQALVTLRPRGGLPVLLTAR
jgi:cytochrome P450